MFLFYLDIWLTKIQDW